MASFTRTRKDDLTVAVLAGVTLALAVFYSHGRIMWSDELFGWMLATDPSSRHMIEAWNAGADGGGLCFYVLARCWLKVFGQSVLAFRLFSAAGVAAAAVFTFRAARHYVSWGIAVSSVALLWFSSDIVLWQVMQARFYGLLLAGVAGACYLAVLTAHRVTGRLLVLTWVCHTVLVGTHPFGAVYSGVVVLAMVVSDAMVRRLRTQLYAAALGGWWVLSVSVRAMRSTAAVGRPHFWTTRPTIGDLGNAYACWSLAVAVVLGTAMAVWFVFLFARRNRLGWLKEQVRGRRVLLLLSGGLLGVPLLVFAVSQRGTSVFVDRYLVPVVIGMSFLLCQLMSGVVSAWEARFGARGFSFGVSAGTGFLLAGALWWTAVVQFPSYWVYPAADTSAGLLARLPKGLPIVVEPIDLFDQLLAYHRQEGYRFMCLLDWENVTDPASKRGEVSGFHQMENWRKVGYFSGSIEYVHQFLAQTPEFVVVDDPGLLWFERKVLPDPRLAVKLLATLPPAAGSGAGIKVWLVTNVDLREDRH